MNPNRLNGDAAATPTEVRLALVEDHAGFRRRLIERIEAHAGWQVVAECRGARQALATLPTHRLDLILLDVRLADGSGVELVSPLKRALPHVPLVMLTVVEEPDTIVRAIRCGAAGYLLKRDAANLVRGIEEILAGQAPVMSPAIAQRLWNLARQDERPSARARFQFSPREWEVLVLAARGKQHGEIALELGIALDTVKNHFRRIYEKSGSHSPIEVLVRLQNGRGLLDGT